MNLILQPWQLLLVIVAGWVHRQQQIARLQTIENGAEHGGLTGLFALVRIEHSFQHGAHG